MGKKYSPSLIGGFVLGGIALLIGALFLFGSGDLFKEKRLWVTYFEGSVGGLNAGAPVTFRGVRVGTVTAVQLRIDPRAATARIPVYFELEPDQVIWEGGKPGQTQKLAADAGVRAKLAMQSLVTGQMQVDLDLLPDTPAELVGADPKVPEIPSVRSELDVFKQQLSELPLRELLASIDRAVGHIDQLVSSPELRDSLRALSSGLEESRKLLATVNQEATPFLKEMTETTRSVRQTSDQARNSIQAVEGEVRQLSSSTRTDLRATLRSADKALQQARTTLASIDGLVADDTRSRADIENTLQNLAQASSALRSFADTVDRNPNSIIIGR